MTAERATTGEAGRPVLPLDGILVLDFSQFLAGPVAAMRLADLGARVIKIERPGVGDIGRTLAFAGVTLDGDTLSFHVMNRGKESYAADLKDSRGPRRRAGELVARADVIIQNFRPGVMERIGLDYESVRGAQPADRLRQRQRLRTRTARGATCRARTCSPSRSPVSRGSTGAAIDGPVPGRALHRRPAGLEPPRPGRDRAAAAPRAHRRGRPRRDEPAGVHARPPVRAAERPPERPDGDSWSGVGRTAPTPSWPRPTACTRPPTATLRSR